MMRLRLDCKYPLEWLRYIVIDGARERVRRACSMCGVHLDWVGRAMATSTEMNKQRDARYKEQEVSAKTT